nr:MAG TPA_asm: hypothetical protein [Caudoviricetes sp.]
MTKPEAYAKALIALEEIGADPDTTYLQETIRVVLEYVAFLEEGNRLRDLLILKLQNIHSLYEEKDRYRLLEISRLRKLLNPNTRK